MNHALRRAQEQRLIALRNAFATIDAFAIPSLSPHELDKYEAAKASLLDNYGKIEEPDSRSIKEITIDYKAARQKAQTAEITHGKDSAQFKEAYAEAKALYDTLVAIDAAMPRYS